MPTALGLCSISRAAPVLRIISVNLLESEADDSATRLNRIYAKQDRVDGVSHDYIIGVDRWDI